MKQMNNESGRSMVEILAVISVISIMTVGAVSGLNYGIQSFRANSAYELIETTARGVIDLFSWRRGFLTTAADFNKLVCDNEVFEGGCLEGKGAAVATGWGNLTLNAKNEGCFEMTLSDVSQRGCELLSNMTWRYAVHGTCAGEQDWNCQAGEQDLTFYVE